MICEAAVNGKAVTSLSRWAVAAMFCREESLVVIACKEVGWFLEDPLALVSSKGGVYRAERYLPCSVGWRAAANHAHACSRHTNTKCSISHQQPEVEAANSSNTQQQEQLTTAAAVSGCCSRCHDIFVSVGSMFRRNVTFL